MTKKALTLALEALEKERPYLGAMPALTSKAITAIKEALSELEQDDEVLGFNGWGFPIEKPSQPEQEPVEDLQAKLKWATEKLEANINWEFVAAAKEEMLKAAWAEIKELREQIKEPEQERCVGCEACIDTACGRDECPKGWPKAVQPEQEPVACIEDGDLYFANEIDWKTLQQQGIAVQLLYTTPPQRTWVGLDEEDEDDIDWEEGGSFRDLVEAVEAKLKEKNT